MSGKDEDVSRDENSPKRKEDKKRGHRKNKGGDASVKKTSSSSSQAPILEEETAEEAGGTLEEVYEVGEELGSGAFSVVKAGVHKKTGNLVAIKILDNYGNLEDGTTFNPSC